MVEIVNSIKTKQEINPTIYAYITPENKTNDGWIKIGYTEREAEKRIKEQTHTAGVVTKLMWEHSARFNDGKYFIDKDFHSYLTRNGIEQRKGHEWFNFYGDYDKSEKMFMDFTFHKNQKQIKSGTKYELRKEQKEAVEKAFEYFKNNEKGEFLWNAKPRFGKTLSSYDLVRKLDAMNVLIVTNRPAIANSWYDDFEKFIEWQTGYKFISESQSLKDRSTWTREEFLEEVKKFKPGEIKNITFLSLQDLKGSIYFGGKFDKLKWVADLDWDLLIIDEAHEGIDTTKTDYAFDKIHRKYTLHLSGTPFKQIANSKFSSDQIYNWSYVDEQQSKESWEEDTFNPYSNLPTLNMFTYQLSNMITDKLTGAALSDEDNMDFAFDLNEFFSTKENGKFVYEDSVKKWLDTLTRNEKYPFSTYELRSELKHTFWFLNRVDSAKALAELLERDPVFGNGNYKIIIAAGQNNFDETENSQTLERVKEAIKNNDKTITLSVGQLTTGVTIPQWSAVLMLNNVKSPALYMQAAFRAQNPYKWVEKDARGIETVYEKKNAYIFDFAPERTLSIVDEFANNLNLNTSSGLGTTEERIKNIKTLLNFFPVIGEDNEGKMIELDANKVMTIPKHIKSKEVVRRGFMSNLLFANISGIFQAPKAVIDIINKFEKTEEGKSNNKTSEFDIEELEDIDVDENGEVLVDNEIIVNKSKYVFVDKEYSTEIEINPDVDSDMDELEKSVVEIIKSNISEINIEKIKEEYDTTDTKIKKIKKERTEKAKDLAEKFTNDLKIEMFKSNAKFEENMKNAKTEEEKVEVEKEYIEEKQKIIEESQKSLSDLISTNMEELNRKTVENLEIEKKNKEKISIEDDIRSRLRGFSRSIPSFVMAYGDENLTLENFDKYTPDSVFHEVTGITLEQFIFLRDGGKYFDEEKQSEEFFNGQLFDSIVFNQSIQEFLAKREELSNYFEENKEDIFDYIPNQQTNQIFTPKWVVKKMVNQLGEENPEIYDDSSKTFIDLYMKSGLYITEIVKKLYNSEKIKSEIPDDKERIKHILENQVYGLAPTEIIYRIATRFIFGNFGENISMKNFKMLDAYPYARDGVLEEKLDEIFRKK